MIPGGTTGATIVKLIFEWVFKEGTDPIQRGDNHKSAKIELGHLKISKTTGPEKIRLA
jgi:hypothetical protein